LLRMVRERAWRIAFFADLIFGMARKLDGKLRRVKRIHIFGRHLPEHALSPSSFLFGRLSCCFLWSPMSTPTPRPAYRQGDSTAYMLGRLTFNPLKHIDPFMNRNPAPHHVVHLGFAFGGAKPVPVNPRNYRKLRTRRLSSSR